MRLNIFDQSMKYKKRQEWLAYSRPTLASIPSRLIAMVIDLVIIYLILYSILKLSVWLGLDITEWEWKNFSHQGVTSKNMNETEIRLFTIFLGFIPTIYFALTTYVTNGQSIGKKFLRIRIVSMYHRRLGLWHCIERSLGYIASTLEAGLGFLQVFWNPNKMTLHDKIGETVVINIRKKNE